MISTQIIDHSQETLYLCISEYDPIELEYKMYLDFQSLGT